MSPGEKRARRAARGGQGAVLTGVALALVAVLQPVPATSALEGRELSAVSTYEYTQNLHPMGHSSRPDTSDSPNSDLAFWGKRAYHGHFDGFRILDITEPDNPVELVNVTDCRGEQGDMVVWGDVLVRTWDIPAGIGATCDGEDVVEGFEGLHVFDVSDPTDPRLVAQVDLSGDDPVSEQDRCGSHTATGVPDLANARLLVYSSGAHCPGIDVVQVPLAAPAAASFLRWEAADDASPGRHCHDVGVILGDAMLAACAGGHGFTVWSLDPADGGSLTDPVFLNSTPVPGTSIGHSASFSWDGELLLFTLGELSGGDPQCQTSSPAEFKTVFFFDSRTGDERGSWVLPRAQTETENCTIHIFNVVPLHKRNILVSGNWQSGIAVVDFTDPSNPVEIAYADPAPLSDTELMRGGDWAAYWFDGRIYESDITRGATIWRMSSSAVADAMKLGHLNPQTQEFTIE